MANLGYIQITRKCNQECRFCSNPVNERSISLAKIKQLIEKYRKNGYEGVIFTGGEPTLYPQLKNAIRYASSHRFHNRIISNGQNLSKMDYFKSLADAGLRHACISLYSFDAAIQGFLTKKHDSLACITASLHNAGKLNIRTDIVTVINKYNAGHLSKTVKWLVKEYPFIEHFVWNNLDPLENRATINLDTIPKLNDFRLELHLAMQFLQENGKTFRVERVPLCYMAEFAHCSTETRKIVKTEERSIYFLDSKGLVNQKGWFYDKTECCKICFLNTICAGLYQMNKYFSSGELFPVFVNKEKIVKQIQDEE